MFSLGLTYDEASQNVSLLDLHTSPTPPNTVVSFTSCFLLRLPSCRERENRQRWEGRVELLQEDFGLSISVFGSNLKKQTLTGNPRPSTTLARVILRKLHTSLPNPSDTALFKVSGKDVTVRQKERAPITL